MHVIDARAMNRDFTIGGCGGNRKSADEKAAGDACRKEEKRRAAVGPFEGQCRAAAGRQRPHVQLVSVHRALPLGRGEGLGKISAAKGGDRRDRVL